MNAYQKNHALVSMLRTRGIEVSMDDASTLRRAELTLHRWAEMECGDSNSHSSWCIERDETTQKAYFVRYPHDGKFYRTAIPDRQRGALRRVAATCKALGIHFYHQTDPRGCALYVSRDPIQDDSFHACCLFPK